MPIGHPGFFRVSHYEFAVILGKALVGPVHDFSVDEENRIVSTPAYMLAGSIGEAADGIEKLVKKVIEMA